jgi:hypothetical protein
LTQYFHPEFGYFHPLPRFRRDLRVALASFACGAALGAVAIVAVNVNYREGDNQLAGVALNKVAASPETKASRPATATRQSSENGALLAGVPLGRSEGFDHASSFPAGVETSDASQPAETPRAAQDADRFPGLRSGEISRNSPVLAGAPQEKGSLKIAAGVRLLHKEASGGRATALAAREESAPHALGSVYARGRTVFWDWSR